LQNAERVAYDRGMAEGEQAAFGRIEARLAAATESLGYVLRDAAREQKTEIARIETQAAGLVMLCLNKMFPLCSTLTGTKEIEALIREAFTQALDEPRIVVRCAAGLRDMLEPRVAESAAAAGYEGRLSVIGAPDLPETDCRVEWAAGGISRDVGAFLAATETAIRQAFPAVEVPEAPQPAAPLPAETAPETFAPESKAPEAPETDIPVETGTVESGTAECSPAESGPTEGVKEIKE
ncbi:MAG TPA: hypothetical protein VL574_14615, partial [Stellaceae bacterium]|nr:hypothetical protein [Stellaceae bacterium]